MTYDGKGVDIPIGPQSAVSLARVCTFKSASGLTEAGNKQLCHTQQIPKRAHEKVSFMGSAWMWGSRFPH